jgi:hypothetical protein
MQLTDEDKLQVELVKAYAHTLLDQLIEHGIEMSAEFMAVLRRLAENPVRDQE